MYGGNMFKSEFYLGELDNAGKIIAFTDFILQQPLPRLTAGPNMFYHVQVEDNEGELDVHVLGWYMGLAKNDPLGHHSIVSMIEQGIIDPIETANKLLDAVKRIVKH
jgi:hypothetical protein